MEAMGAAFTNITQASAAGVKEGQITSKGLRHIILRHSQEEGIRWWLTIGFDRLKRYWRLWKSLSMR